MSVESSNLQPPTPSKSDELVSPLGETTSAPPLRCALTGEVISPEEAYWAPPLVTLEQLISTVAATATRTPGDLTRVLFGEQPKVPYSPRVREELAARRTTEQLKLLGVLLLLALLIAAPIIYFTMR